MRHAPRGPGNRDVQKRTQSSRRRIAIQHCAQQAGSGESQGVCLPRHYFSASFINQSEYSPAAPKTPQAGSRRPSAGTARDPTADPAPAEGAVRDRAPRVGEGEEASDPPTIWRHRNDARKTGVLDRDRVAGVISATLR